MESTATRPAARRADALRVAPHSVEAEQSLLGALMVDNRAWDEVADRVGPDDFYRREHRLVYEAIQALAEAGEPFDAVTVSDRLRERGELEAVGGLAYLAALVEGTPTAANVRAYAQIVRDRSVLRQLIHVGTRIADAGFNPEGRDTRELLDYAERLVFEIAEQGSRIQAGFTPLKDLLTAAVERIERLYEEGSAITGVATGFADFDELTSGLQPSDLVVVAGRPSMGKTTFALNIAEHVAIKGGRPVAVFSMEMPGEQLALRLMSSLGRVNQQRVRTGRLEDEDWPRITSAVTLLAQAPIYIDDTPALSPTELRARARRLQRQFDGGLGLVVVDYLQLMQVPGGSENRATEISEISRSLKALAKELHVPVIALSQLNRNLEQRPNKRPVMSDLRESGSIEQDADLVVFIYRDEVYNPESPDKGTAEIIVAKQRNGPTGTVRLTFLGQYTRFENFAHDPYADEA
ncbi:replicative DNA helicase [Inmirania thermothiophila]|uniref:Replicative DNA helicase n=1 Tax=Inmirania thermothiophila TaxID=1750597 RepID=A0A3N1Y9F2_9GAMM|nr:replicative DNA helicase [Inmirania thermothiophila]ROR35171.1 primary replicative DNA helicase [Inmirania thermothiophila]